MISARRPEDEQERLESLRRAHILDTPPEREFDDLALVASTICGTPIALVSLIDADRQWFKARIGIEPPETPRDVAFCAHAILERKVFVVPDATRDERFHDNPLVTGDTHIRFYAGAPISDGEGHQLGTVCTIDTQPREITPEQNRALEALARQASALIALRKTARALDAARGHLEDLLDRTLLLVQLSDRQGRLRFVNRAWREALGYDSAEAAKLRIQDLLAPEPHASRKALLAVLRAGAGAVSTTLVTRDGKEIDVEGSITSHEDGAVFAIFRDVTELHEVERLRNELVSNVSHELRTPLTSIAGALGLLKAGVGGELPADAVELVSVAESNAQRLRALVDDILDVEKIGAGRLDLSFSRIEVEQLVDAAFEVVGAMARTSGVRLEKKVEPGLAVRGEQRRLVQALSNLVSNAVKHSPAGAPVVVGATPVEGRVRIGVQDHGPGVPDSERLKIFERFRQSTRSASRARDPSGTGLGLPIARGIVEQHGGRIGLDSVPGEGSCFWMELPANPD